MMYAAVLLLAAAVAAAAAHTQTTASSTPRPPGRNTLVYEDTFDVWSPVWSTRQVPYADESSCAAADPGCARTIDGQMVLSVRPDPDQPGHYLTGHVGTHGTAQFTYGYFETKAKFPPLRGVHSAFWLQTTEDYIPGQAEIDVAECFGRSAVWHNVYWRTADMGAGEFLVQRVITDLGGPGTQADWHVYGLDWRPDRYDFYVDGDLVATITSGLSDRPKFLVLSVLMKDFETRFFDPARIRDYKARFKYVRVWR